MAEDFLAMPQLTRMHKTNLLVDKKVESEGTLLGSVVSLRHDKYGRVDGIEVECPDRDDLLVIPYDRILGLDPAENIVKVKLPKTLV